MAKFYGAIGYADPKENAKGVWTEGEIVEKNYFGDLIRNNRGIQTSDQVNDDVNVANEISVIADPYAFKNFHLMRYVRFMGTEWKIKNAEVQYPRLILTLGGVYNGK